MIGLAKKFINSEISYESDGPCLSCSRLIKENSRMQEENLRLKTKIAHLGEWAAHYFHISEKYREESVMLHHYYKNNKD